MNKLAKVFRLQLERELGRGTQVQIMNLTRKENKVLTMYDGGIADIVNDQNQVIFKGPSVILEPLTPGRYIAWTELGEDSYVAYQCKILFEPEMN